MMDSVPEWISQQGHQGRRNGMSNTPGMRSGFSRPGLMEREDGFALVMRSLLFGENEYENELMEQMMLADIVRDSGLVEYPFQTPPDEDIWGPINLGVCEETGAPAGIFPHEVHTLIVGRSGSGKTTANIHLMRQHLDSGIPILNLDFENEYAERLNDNRMAVLGLDSFKWNPLEVPPGMDPIYYQQLFCSIFADHCGLLIASKGFLLNELAKLYRTYGVYDGGDTYPSMYELSASLKKTLKELRPSSRTYTYCEVCINRVDGFILAFSKVLDCSKGHPLHLVTRKSVSLQLHGVDFEYSALMVSLLLSWLCCHRIANGLRNKREHHLAVFIDEAQRVFDAQLERRQHQGIPTISHLVATVRKYNMHLFISAQQPSLLASSIKANSFARLQLTLGDGGCIMDMGSSMFLTPEQVRFSRRLSVGQAIVKLSGRWHEPFVVRINYDG